MNFAQLGAMVALWAMARLKEPSTWAGIGVFLSAHLYNFAWLASPDVIQYGAMFVAAVLAVVIKELSLPKVTPTKLMSVGWLPLALLLILLGGCDATSIKAGGANVSAAIGAGANVIGSAAVAAEQTACAISTPLDILTAGKNHVAANIDKACNPLQTSSLTPVGIGSSAK